MNIPEAIKQLEELKSCCGKFDAVEIIEADSEALKIAIEVLKEKSVKNQIELNKELRRQRAISCRKQRTAQEVLVQEQNCSKCYVSIESLAKELSSKLRTSNKTS